VQNINYLLNFWHIFYSGSLLVPDFPANFAFSQTLPDQSNSLTFSSFPRPVETVNGTDKMADGQRDELVKKQSV